jgi:hypothetical protein
VVEKIYSSLLGRTADATGLANFTAALAQGMSQEQVKAQIAGSDEFFARAGATNQGFLQALYQDLLARQIEQTALAAWTTAMQNGMGRSAVAGLVAMSGEGERYVVDRDYEQLLRRRADTGGLFSWGFALEAGQISDEAAVAALAGSDEYFGAL